MPRIIEIEVHPTQTRVNGRQYQFTPKHHGGEAGASCWIEELTREEEFRIFDDADAEAIHDDEGNHYGVARIAEEEGLRVIGTWSQQMAEFPVCEDGQPWHGYPCWPLNEMSPENRRGEKMRPAKEVFRKMCKAGLINRRESKRLMKGDPT
jgi:hypothetical protein